MSRAAITSIAATLTTLSAKQDGSGGVADIAHLPHGDQHPGGEPGERDGEPAVDPLGGEVDRDRDDDCGVDHDQQMHILKAVPAAALGAGQLVDCLDRRARRAVKGRAR